MKAQLPVLDNVEPLHPFRWLNAGVLFLTRALDVTLCNDCAREFLAEALPLGQPTPLEGCLSPHGDVYRTLVDLVSCAKEPKDTVILWETNGRVRHVLMDGHAYRDAKGNFVGLYVILKDLGNMVALEHHMLRTDKLATVGKIAAGIAHEIRNPLTTLKGFLQLFEGHFESDANLTQYLAHTRVMLGEIERVNGLVSELLLLAKPREMQIGPCDISVLFEEMNPVIQSECLLRDMEFVFTLEAAPVVMADSAMLKQVVLNLVKNAIEAMNEGGKLGIAVRFAPPWVMIDVVDTGPGIPYYQADKIFDAFFTTKETGTGLGLPICQSIIASHGGEIHVASKGFGTTFSVCLPLPAMTGDGPLH